MTKNVFKDFLEKQTLDARLEKQKAIVMTSSFMKREQQIKEFFYGFLNTRNQQQRCQRQQIGVELKSSSFI